MPRMLLYACAAALAVVVRVLAVERQAVGYAASAIGDLASTDVGPSPQAAIDAGAEPDGTSILLAVGDIAECGERFGFARRLPGIADLLGLQSAQGPATTPAIEVADLARAMPGLLIRALGDIAYDKGRPTSSRTASTLSWAA